jgi:hypothetical protein
MQEQMVAQGSHYMMMLNHRTPPAARERIMLTVNR